MICAEVRPLLDAYFDSELDLASSLKVEQHLSECAVCAGTISNLERLREELTPAVFNRSQEGDLDRLRASIRKATSSVPNRRLRWNQLPAWAAVAAALVLVVVWSRTPNPAANLNRELVDSHVRSLMADHLVDVPSSDRHTVKPWFQGKVEFAPDVPDLGDKGYELVGGRLDILNGRPTAAIVYKRRGHFINTWTSRTYASDAGASFSTVDGYQIAHWTASGLEHWAVSDMNRAELMVFVDAVRGRTP